MHSKITKVSCSQEDLRKNNVTSSKLSTIMKNAQILRYTLEANIHPKFKEAVWKKKVSLANCNLMSVFE